MNSFRQIFYREVTIRKQLSHPNVVQFVGVTNGLAPLSMVLEWMPNGDVRFFVGNHPEADRLQLVRHVASCSVVLHGFSHDLPSSSISVTVSSTFTIMMWSMAISEAYVRTMSTDPNPDYPPSLFWQIGQHSDQQFGLGMHYKLRFILHHQLHLHGILGKPSRWSMAVVSTRALFIKRGPILADQAIRHLCPRYGHYRGTARKLMDFYHNPTLVYPISRCSQANSHSKHGPTSLL